MNQHNKQVQFKHQVCTPLGPRDGEKSYLLMEEGSQRGRKTYKQNRGADELHAA